MTERIVLAYSGGLDTSVAIRWLIEEHDAEVVLNFRIIGQEFGCLLHCRETVLALHVLGNTEQVPECAIVRK